MHAHHDGQSRAPSSSDRGGACRRGALDRGSGARRGRRTATDHRAARPLDTQLYPRVDPAWYAPTERLLIYLRRNVGVNSTAKVMISIRPRNMAAVQIQV